MAVLESEVAVVELVKVLMVVERMELMVEERMGSRVLFKVVDMVEERMESRVLFKVVDLVEEMMGTVGKAISLRFSPGQTSPLRTSESSG